MLRLAGEIADGVVLWACPSQYVRDVVVPEVTAGRHRAGKPIEGFHILAAVPSAMSHDRATALAGVRNELHRYFGLPFYRAMFQAAGFADDVAAFDAALHPTSKLKSWPSVSDSSITYAQSATTPLFATGFSDTPTRGSPTPC